MINKYDTFLYESCKDITDILNITETYDLFISAYNKEEMVRDVFEQINAKEKIWLLFPDYNLDKKDIDWLVPHQANLRIISATAKKLEMDMSQVVVTLDRHGNTSAGSIPSALDEAVRDGRIQRGQLILMEAFGGGLTWGSVLARF